MAQSNDSMSNFLDVSEDNDPNDDVFHASSSGGADATYPAYLAGTSAELRTYVPFSRRPPSGRRRNTTSEMMYPPHQTSTFRRGLLRSTPREGATAIDIYGDPEREEREEMERLRRIEEGTATTDDYPPFSNEWMEMYNRERPEWQIKRNKLRYSILCKIPLRQTNDHWRGVVMRMWDEKQGLKKMGARLIDLKTNRTAILNSEMNTLLSLYKKRDMYLRSLNYDCLNEAQFIATECALQNATSEAKRCEQRISNLEEEVLIKAIEDIGLRIRKLERAIARAEGWMYMTEDPQEAIEFQKLITRFQYSMPMPTGDEPPMLPPYNA